MEYRSSVECKTDCSKTAFLQCKEPCKYNYSLLSCECDPYLAKELLNAANYKRIGGDECPLSHKYKREDFGRLYCSDQPPQPMSDLHKNYTLLKFLYPAFSLPTLVSDATYLIKHPKTRLKSFTTGAVAGVLVFLVSSILRNAC